MEDTTSPFIGILHVLTIVKFILELKYAKTIQVSKCRHGVKQPRNPWSDGPEYITQCPIQPGHSFNYKIIFSTEVGTLWWHAHSDWSRATVHGAIIVYPKPHTNHPFPTPHEEVPIIFGNIYIHGLNFNINKF